MDNPEAEGKCPQDDHRMYPIKLTINKFLFLFHIFTVVKNT